MQAPNIFMLVDDDSDDRFFFQMTVNEIHPSYECLTANDGAEALETLRTLDPLPHFIFLDLNMPGMGGKDCLRALKEDERLKQIPVIIYSTSTRQEDIDAVMALGAAHYIVKPVKIGKLHREIVKALATIQSLPGR